MSDQMELVERAEGLLVEAYHDVKKSVQLGIRKFKDYNKHKQLLRLINLMRSTENANTKTIAFQVDGLSKPLWIKLLGSANCSLRHVLSWAKTERILKLRDAQICVEAGAPVGTLCQARDFVLTSLNNLVDEVICFISLAFSFAVLPDGLDKAKERELKKRYGEDCLGIYAGDLTVSSLFYPSTDDRDMSAEQFTGNEILFGCASVGADRTVLLLLADQDVILFDNSRLSKKYLSKSQKRSVAAILDQKASWIMELSQFVRQAYMAFGNLNVPAADTYITATRFAQAFLSMAGQNFTGPVDHPEMSRRAALALRKDAARLRCVMKNSYMNDYENGYIDLSREELAQVHQGAAALSEDQSSRIFHDLHWQDQAYENATADKDVDDIPWDTPSNDEYRNDAIRTVYSQHRRAIRKKRETEGDEKNALKLNLAVMCYNRLTKNEKATMGFENVLREYDTTMVNTDKYKAVYTPHSGAAVLYFDEGAFDGLKLIKYQPIKGKVQSVLGLTATLHDQLVSAEQDLVDRKVYSKLQEGLHNITVTQEIILEAIDQLASARKDFRLKVSKIFISIGEYTADEDVKRWLEREVLGFLAKHGIPNDKSSSGYSSMYDAFAEYYPGTNSSGLELKVDRAGNLHNVMLRVCSSGTYVLRDLDDGSVFKVRKDGQEITDYQEVRGRLQLVHRPGKQPSEDREYIDRIVVDKETIMT